jgi:hypothetical protein
MNHYVNDNSDNIINEINQKIDQLDPNKSGQACAVILRVPIAPRRRWRTAVHPKRRK